MNININLNTIITKLIPFIIIVLIAMIINLILYLFLPKVHFNNDHMRVETIEYKKYKIKESFEEKKIVKAKKKRVEAKKEYQLISNILLKMIYQEENNQGWIVIAEMSSRNSEILGINEAFKNYRLERIYDTYVVFSKNKKEYKLSLNKEEKNVSYKQVEVEQAVERRIEKVDDQYQLTRGLLNSYTKDSSKIWKEISIKEIKKDGKIDGFRITRIKNRSVFKELGLMKNDVIKSVNNIKLKSYADAFSVYKKMNKMENMKFIVLRGNEEVELEYEIK